MSDHLTCQELVELVTEYIEGGLAAPERARFEQHLLLCDGCADYVEQMRRTIGAAGRLREEAIPESVKRNLLAAFRKWKAS